MVFLKKIQNPDPRQDYKMNKAIDEFIEKGGLVASDVSNLKKVNDWKKVLLRIRNDILKEIDNSIADRVGMTRTSWILESIQEKLNKEVY